MALFQLLQDWPVSNPQFVMVPAGTEIDSDNPSYKNIPLPVPPMPLESLCLSQESYDLMTAWYPPMCWCRLKYVDGITPRSWIY